MGPNSFARYIVKYEKQDTEIILNAGFYHDDDKILMTAVLEYFKQFEQEKEGTNYDRFVQVVKDYNTIFKKNDDSRKSFNISFKYQNIMSSKEYTSDPRWVSIIKKHKGCGFYVTTIPKHKPYIIMSGRESEEEYVTYVNITNCLDDPELIKDLKKDQEDLKKDQEQEDLKRDVQKKQEEIKKTKTKTNPFSLLYYDDDDDDDNN